MIFAAGLGTRLRPLTNDRPKALVEVNGEPMLKLVAKRLIAAGTKTLIINIHHFADKVEEYIRSENDFGVEVLISDERDLLRDTGGGLIHAKDLLGDAEAFIVHNTDVICPVDLKQMFQDHIKSGAVATLAVSRRDTSRYLLFEGEQLAGWRNAKTGEAIGAASAAAEAMAFSGIQVVSPEIFKLTEKQGAFPIIPMYLDIAKNHPVKGWVHDQPWMDLGTPERLKRAEEWLNGQNQI